MIRLKAKEVARHALLHHAEGRLSAQGPTPECRYRDRSGRPCAIGAALTDEQAASIPDNLQNSAVWALRSYIRADDMEALTSLQLAHDNWTQPNSNEAEARFLSIARAMAGVTK